MEDLHNNEAHVIKQGQAMDKRIKIYTRLETTAQMKQIGKGICQHILTDLEKEIKDLPCQIEEVSLKWVATGKILTAILAIELNFFVLGKKTIQTVWLYEKKGLERNLTTELVGSKYKIILSERKMFTEKSAKEIIVIFSRAIIKKMFAKKGGKNAGNKK